MKFTWEELEKVFNLPPGTISRFDNFPLKPCESVKHVEPCQA